MLYESHGLCEITKIRGTSDCIKNNTLRLWKLNNNNNNRFAEFLRMANDTTQPLVRRNGNKNIKNLIRNIKLSRKRACVVEVHASERAPVADDARRYPRFRAFPISAAQWRHGSISRRIAQHHNLHFHSNH